MTLKDLRSFSQIWKKRLRLQDWKVTIRWMTTEEAASTYPDSDGYCSWNAQHKLADIVIKKTVSDPKRVLVHELLHLLWEGNLERGTILHGNLVQKEIAINTLAEVLVNG